MDRRDFIKSLTASTAALHTLAAHAGSITPVQSSAGVISAATTSVDGHTKLVSFTRNAKRWTVYEDLRVRDGVFTFVCSDGSARVLRWMKAARALCAKPSSIGSAMALSSAANAW